MGMWSTVACAHLCLCEHLYACVRVSPGRYGSFSLAAADIVREYGNESTLWHSLHEYARQVGRSVASAPDWQGQAALRGAVEAVGRGRTSTARRPHRKYIPK